MGLELRDLNVPDFGRPAECPELPPSTYARRRALLLERMRARQLEALVVYGDREHFANLAYLTGFDPRFEEAMLLLRQDGRTLLVVGNECMGYLPAGWPSSDACLFQEFSLLGQPRESSPPLADILTRFGIRSGMRVGCVGWKYFEGRGVPGGRRASELPSYLVDALRQLAGGDQVDNATDLLMNPADGLRATLDVDEIACFEFAAAHASESVWNLVRAIRPGVSERELSRHLQHHGLPLSCHLMVSTGDKAARGLASPSDRRVRLGDPFTTALGLWGSLVCRAGLVARDRAEAPASLRDLYDRLAVNYMEVVFAWYEAVKVGAGGGDVYRAADARRDASLWRFALNPGHLIHLDEWLHSPFFAGSAIPLGSGMAIQMDIIPVPSGPPCCVNAEDGIVLADASLRRDLAAKYPDCWKRIAARQRFMREQLGVAVDDSLLPLCNAPGVFAPYLLQPSRALARSR